jgi:hypothetical protein
MQYFKMLFSSGPYMPHGYCFLWNPGLIGLHVISDLLIALSYLSIPFTLGYFVRKRRDLPFTGCSSALGFSFLRVAPRTAWMCGPCGMQIIGFPDRSKPSRLWRPCPLPYCWRS